jgi:hypothetical protein
MPKKIRISTSEVSLEALLNDSDTAEAIWNALPIEGQVNRWGEEIYFSIPVQLAEAPDARQEMAVGELGYWPTGSAFCIFFGPTPVSDGDVPKAYSNVNPFGEIEGDATAFRVANDGDAVSVTRVAE